MTQKYLILMVGIVSLYAQPQTVTQWTEAYRAYAPRLTTPSELAVTDLMQALDAFILAQKHFIQTTPWFNGSIDLYAPKMSDERYQEYIQPFALKVDLHSSSRTYFFGDLHGDVQALSASLQVFVLNKVIAEDFKILLPNIYFCFLGDFVDRGQYGPELLTLLLTFAAANPGRVFLMRGNHENLEINKQTHLNAENGMTNFYDQVVKLQIRKPDSVPLKNILNKIAYFYNILPVVAFIGCDNNYIQCCHGGLEARYNPQNLLVMPYPMAFERIKTLPSPDWWQKIQNRFEDFNVAPECGAYFNPQSMTPFNIGFMWNDFQNELSPSTQCIKNRGLVVGENLANHIFEQMGVGNIKVRGIIRGHQHSPSLPGLLNPANQGIFVLPHNIITLITTGLFTDVISFTGILFTKDFSNWTIERTSLDLRQQKPAWAALSDKLDKWQNKAAA